jgi:hypothetical protein
MQKTVNEIKSLIKKKQKGKIYFASDFAFLGAPKTINKSLERLEQSKTIIRIARGIYYYPKTDIKLGLGILYPSLEEIAKEIAKRDKARIVPTGIYALNKLGLSTQVPMNIVYLTDGTPRRIKIGNGKGILFKHTAPKNLVYKNDLILLIVSALKAIGKENIKNEDIEKLRILLSSRQISDWKDDLKLAPAWIKQIIISIV